MKKSFLFAGAMVAASAATLVLFSFNEAPTERCCMKPAAERPPG